jgi:2',3'-cyclic-nucleotide 2'-phosphodiesterase/3'-nucleotidase
VDYKVRRMINARKKIVTTFLLLLFLSVVAIFQLPNTMVFAADSVKEVDIVGINDFHGQMIQVGKGSGAAKYATILEDEIYKNPDNTILVSIGDNYTGQGISNLTYGASVNEFYKTLGVSLSAAGNHEFDWGPDVASNMKKWQKDGSFHYVVSNIYSKQTQQPVAWARPYEVIEKAGIKIGFIGLTTLDTVDKNNPLYLKDMEFRSPAVAAQYWSEYLKSGKAPEGKVDVVIVLAHMGAEQDKNGNITGEIAPVCAVKTIDAVLTGHEHTFVSGTLNGIPVVQGLKYGRAYTKIQIMLDENGKVTEIKPFAKELKKDFIAETEADGRVKAIVDKYNTDSHYGPLLHDVIATTNTDLSYEREKGLSPLSEWICNLMKKNASADIAMLNGNVIKEGPTNGTLTVGNVYEMLLDDLTLYSFKLKGSELKKVFEYGIEKGLHDEETGWLQQVGVYVKYDKSLPKGSRIISMTLENGQTVDMNKYYTVATSGAMYAGVNGFNLTSAMNVVNKSVSIRDLMINELKKTRTLSSTKVEYYTEMKKD